MTIGTLGFVKERLTEAREALGLTKVALSELIEVSPMAVSQYESGPQTPRSDVLDRICDKLGYPRAFFLNAAFSDESTPIFWRSNTSATKIARLRGLQRLKWAKEILAYLNNHFDFPSVSFPRFSVSESNFRSLSNANIEGFAKECREFWKFGTSPIPDLLLELENSGAITSRINMGAETLDAFSQWSSSFGRPFVFLGKDHASAVRSRFDAAHELAHLVLHWDIDRKRVNSREDWARLEQQAHRFSASFLLPESSFSNELWAPTLDGFAALKERWKVSIGMMIMRAEHVGITGKKDTQRLFINYNRRGWRADEPLDNSIKFEEPRVLRRSFEALAASGERTPEKIRDDLCLPAREIEEISAVHPGFFGARQAEIKAMPKPKFESTPDLFEGSNVVSFPDRNRRS